MRYVDTHICYLKLLYFDIKTVLFDLAFSNS